MHQISKDAPNIRASEVYIAANEYCIPAVPEKNIPCLFSRNDSNL